MVKAAAEDERRWQRWRRKRSLGRGIQILWRRWSLVFGHAKTGHDQRREVLNALEVIGVGGDGRTRWLAVATAEDGGVAKEERAVALVR